jgi:hypothetical protein
MNFDVRLLRNEGLDGSIRFDTPLRFVPAAWAWSDAGKDDRYGRIQDSQLAHERFEVVEDLFRGLTVVHVVATNVHEDKSWLVRANEPLRVADQVCDLKRIDAAIDKRVMRQIFVQRFPAIELRVPDEQDGVLRRRVRFIRRLVFGDFLFEALLQRIVLSSIRWGETHPDRRKQQR